MQTSFFTYYLRNIYLETNFENFKKHWFVNLFHSSMPLIVVNSRGIIDTGIMYLIYRILYFFEVNMSTQNVPINENFSRKSTTLTI